MWFLRLLHAGVICLCLPLASAQPSGDGPLATTEWDFGAPLRVCFVSLLDFSGRCNGSPIPNLEELEQPDGPVPRGGWCQDKGGGDFCGYDVDVWRSVTPFSHMIRFHAIWDFLASAALTSGLAHQPQRSCWPLCLPCSHRQNLVLAAATVPSATHTLILQTQSILGSRCC